MFSALILKRLDARARTAGGEGGGLFKYSGVRTGMSVRFQWDLAGITRSGNIVIIEEEKPPFSPLHIQAHLSRVRLMIALGERVERLVWIIPSSSYMKLDRVVAPWVSLEEKFYNFSYPKIEYRDSDGRYLAAINVGFEKGVTNERISNSRIHSEQAI